MAISGRECTADVLPQPNGHGNEAEAWNINRAS